MPHFSVWKLSPTPDKDNGNNGLINLNNELVHPRFLEEKWFPCQDRFHIKLSSPAFLPVHVLDLSFRTVPVLDSLLGIKGISQCPRLDEAPTPQDLEQPGNKLAIETLNPGSFSPRYTAT